MTTYDKAALTQDQHLHLLSERGLHIPDESLARHYLSNISYFRLSAYTRAYYRSGGSHQFRPGTCFDDILDLYIFDRELRLLLLDAIERIEVALRSQLANTLAEHHGAHGYLQEGVFNDRYNYTWLYQKLAQPADGPLAETFLTHYRTRYKAAPAQPPIWMAVEILSFKEVSILFANLRKPDDRQRIEAHFGWKHPVLKSWFRSLSDLRNSCAHHARVWNREFGSRPEIPRKVNRPWPGIPSSIPVHSSYHPEQQIDPRRRLYAQVVVIEALLQVVSPQSLWAVKLQQLMERFPNVSRTHMGFPDEWQKLSFWQQAFGSMEGIE
ncbi:Abi family protein [Nitrincola tapanii]|uniref:Abi family protein n=1 Tax=Nitrincola tapanii TaxID=1708751 RepID=UPI00190F352E|nr:Abi family protein [Nitrincola tapanii]